MKECKINTPAALSVPAYTNFVPPATATPVVEVSNVVSNEELGSSWLVEKAKNKEFGDWMVVERRKKKNNAAKSGQNRTTDTQNQNQHANSQPRQTQQNPSPNQRN